MTQHRATFDHILKELRLIGIAAYKDGYKSIDAATYGIPQHRERVYIVGLLRNSLVPTDFEWPEPCKCKPLPKVLRWPTGDGDKPRKALRKYKAFLAKTSPTVRMRLHSAFERMRQKDLDPRDLRCPMAVGIDASKPRWLHERLPCLTRARIATGHYLLA